MGIRDSSKTRVEPVFSQLLKRDPVGTTWFDALIALGSRSDVVASVAKEQNLLADHGARWGKQEMALPAPQALLLHLAANLTPQAVAASTASVKTQETRRLLAARDERTMREAAAAVLAGMRGKQWFILEGASKPDALLEGESVVLCIEGKRTEAKCTTSTEWMEMRSQLVRHMDAATEYFPHKRVLGLLVVEGDGGMDAHLPSTHWRDQATRQYDPAMIKASLPHRKQAERDAIVNGILGVTTWQAVCAATDVKWESLPDVI